MLDMSFNKPFGCSSDDDDNTIRSFQWSHPPFGDLSFFSHNHQPCKPSVNIKAKNMNCSVCWLHWNTGANTQGEEMNKRYLIKRLEKEMLAQGNWGWSLGWKLEKGLRLETWTWVWDLVWIPGRAGMMRWDKGLGSGAVTRTNRTVG